MQLRSRIKSVQSVARRASPPLFTTHTFRHLRLTDLARCKLELHEIASIRRKCAKFSIASAPHEETLMVATRMRDTAFKRVLRMMPAGTPVRIEGPSGDLILQNDSTRAAVFLAGGIGIAPFRSIVHWAAKEKLPQRVFLFYSNRQPEEAAFLAELQSLEKDYPKYKLIASMTEMEKSHQPWNGETGLINQEMLGRHLKDAASPIYYIAGPPTMVKGLQETLREARIKDDDIRAEEFAGY